MAVLYMAKVSPLQKRTICQLITTGKMLTEACDEVGAKRMEVARLLAKDQNFDKSVRLAMHMGAHHHAHESLKLADRVRDHKIDFRQARVVFDIHKWAAAKLANGTFADVQKISGGSGQIGSDDCLPIVKFEIVKCDSPQSKHDE